MSIVQDIFKERAYITQGYNAVSYRYPGWGFRHKGIDFGTDGKNIAVHAPVSGTITYAGEAGAWGVLVIVFDGDYSWQFAHMVLKEVEVGQYVEIGQKIGYVGNSGASTGIHLHLGCYEGQSIKYVSNVPTFKYVNPFTIYENYMQELTELKQLIESALNPLCVMKDASIRLKNDLEKTYKEVPKTKVAEVVTQIVYRLKGRGFYDKKEFEEYKKVKF